MFNHSALHSMIRAFSLVSLVFLSFIGSLSYGQIPIADSLLQEAKKGNLSGETVDNYTIAGVHYAKNGYFDQAMDCFLKAAKLGKELNDSSRLYICYIDLGNLFAKIQDSARSVNYYAQALEFVHPSDSLKIAKTHLNLGNLTRDSSDFLKALNIYLAVNDSFRVSKCYNNIGQLYEIKFNDRKKALSYYHLGERYYPPILYFNLANAYYYLTNFQRAKYYYELSVETEAENSARKYDALIGLSKCYAELANFKKAYNILEEGILMKQVLDSISNADILYRKLLELEEKDFEIKKNKYESELKLQNEINRNHELTIQNRNSIVMVLLISLLIVLIAVIFIFYYYKRSQQLSQNLKATMEQLEIESQNIELQALQTTMNPHFVSNSLSSLQYFIAKNDERSSINFVSDFANLMHDMFEVSMIKFIPISREMELLQAYLSFEKRRIGKNIHMIFNIGDNVDDKEDLIPPMLLQPFIENSIWYGFSSTSDKQDLIKINFSIIQENTLQIEIMDNGFGLKEESKLGWGSTEVAAKRIKNLWRDESDKHLTVKNRTNEDGEVEGASVIIQIPYHVE